MTVQTIRQVPGAATDPAVRVEFELTLRAVTALHLGGAFGGPTADLALARDGRGRRYVPGSSWAGVLRQATERVIGLEEAKSIFGYAPVRGEPGDGDDGRASRLTVSDTVIGDTDPVELRTGVGIDRRTGAAAERIRFDREVLAPGTTMTLLLRYDGSDADGDVTALRMLVSGIRHRGLRVGAGTRRGLGRLECSRAVERTVDLRSRSSLLTWLGGDVEGTAVEGEDAEAEVLRVVLAWRPRRPVVVGGPAPGHSADLVPLLTRHADGSGLVPVLPGTSVKGVLRSLTERIVRTVLDLGPPREDFVAAADSLAAEVPAIEALFGSRRRAGAVAIADITADTPPTSPERWGDYLARGTTPPSWHRERAHVAIDRWTGGAAESLLFTVQETVGVTWPALQIEVDRAALMRTLPDPADQRAALVLLGTAVATLAEGDAGLGHGTTRGLGEIEIIDIDVRVSSCPGLPPWPPDSETGSHPVGRWWAWLRHLDPAGGWVRALRKDGGTR